MAQNLLKRATTRNMACSSNGEESIVGMKEVLGERGLLGASNQSVESWCGFPGERVRTSATILLVEDQSFVREVAGEVLRCAGYEVLTAKAAPEAIHAYEQFSGKVDLLLSDIVLPGQSGRALARDLKQRNSNIKVLLISGYAMQPADVESDESTKECLPKPFSAEVLLRRVREVLSAENRVSGEPSQARFR